MEVVSPYRRIKNTKMDKINTKNIEKNIEINTKKLDEGVQKC
ncbi:hypothetical protein [Clostridium hydrogenum]|nr:hypothetical protein [Clostridium hydrogenum]